ncbi:MAG TPA: hypothetical protein VES40_06635, partial [Ilumatobacteraceae bacterium]|nr:hypothetical protein [Ilumatobacteraceae bacterium]
MEIRELVAGGGDQSVALFAAVLPGSATAEADNLDEPEAFLRDPNSFVLGAFIDDAPVGLVWGIQMRSPSGRLTTYIHELNVHEGRSVTSTTGGTSTEHASRIRACAIRSLSPIRACEAGRVSE